MQAEAYKINLNQFEGPLDLLLYLVRKNDLNIYEIPISFITEEYLKYLGQMRELNIDVAGDFLQMAAELMLFKSRMLLPQEGEGEEEEGPDPQAELARRLLLYQRFKTAASLLTQRWMLGREVFKRGRQKITDGEEKEVPIQGEVYQLMQAFSKVLARLPKDVYHEVARDRISISDRIYQMIETLSTKKALTLEELLPDPLTRYDVVITFLALLEMTRLRMIRVHQEENFGKMLIRWAMETLSGEESKKLVKEVF
ncbi:MAG: segregation/condensation protein A [Deltaproteobacteria bacterium]|nr:segregation/condensation protein A [Deltaproteobacteria bacterium]